MQQPLQVYTGLAGRAGEAGPGTAAESLSILHVAAPAEIGGLERVVHFLVAGQVAAGHRVHLLAVVDESLTEHPLVRAVEEAGATATLLALPGRAYRRERAEVRRLCREVQLDVVHTHGYRPDVVDSGAARAERVPVVTTIHGFTRGGLKGRLYEWLQRRSYRRFDAVVAVSRVQVEEVVAAGADRGRVHLVPNAWGDRSEPLARGAARSALGLDDGPFHLGWVGRLGHEKGLDVLIDALSLLPTGTVVLSVVGDGGERQRLEARAAANSTSAAIRWHGSVARAGRLFAAFDGLALSSRTEGVPIVLFEAMSAGTPIVATRVGGVPDVVTEGEALLVPAEDPAALAAAIRALISDGAAAARRAEAAHRRLTTHFAPAPWLARYEAIYRAIRRRRV